MAGKDGLTMTRLSANVARAAACVLAVSNPAAAQSYEVLVDFNCSTIGCAPGTTLIQADDGFLYGTTSEGGPASDRGTLFRLGHDGAFTLLGYQALSFIEGRDGLFYGIEGEGGAFGYGTLYRMDRAGTVTVLHAFDGITGAIPMGIAQAHDGSFYGMTTAGGALGFGTVFRMDASGAVTVIRDFDEATTLYLRGFFQARDGFFYGTTYSGGTGGAGFIFRMNETGAVTVLHSFETSTGGGSSSAYADVMQAGDGYFYGTTMAEGSSSAGTVFRMDAAGRVRVLHEFDMTGGAYPYGAPIEGADGFFYGTTGAGGEYGYGTLYRMDRSGTFTVLHAFDGMHGANPVTPPTWGDDGAIYGTAAFGGAHTHGIAYRLRPTSAVTLLAPAGGERVFARAPFEIRWAVSGASTACSAEISRDAGVSYAPIAECTLVTASTGRCTWTPAGPPTHQARVRLTALGADGSAISDVSATDFAIAAGGPRIQLLAPRPNTRWPIGSVVELRWQHNLGLGARVSLEVSRDGGATWGTAAETLTTAAPVENTSFVVTGPPTGGALVRMRWLGGPAVDAGRHRVAIVAGP